MNPVQPLHFRGKNQYTPFALPQSSVRFGADSPDSSKGNSQEPTVQDTQRQPAGADHHKKSGKAAGQAKTSEYQDVVDLFKKQSADKAETQQTENATKSDDKNQPDSKKPAQETNQPGRERDAESSDSSQNFKFMLGMFFKTIVPISLSLPLFTGPAGWVVALASLPISNLSGRYGDKVMESINTNSLNPVTKSMFELQNVISNPKEHSGEDFITKFNSTVENVGDVFDINRLPLVGGLLRFLNKVPVFGKTLSQRVLGLNPARWITRTMNLSKDKGVGKFINNKFFIFANANMAAANGKTMVEGLKNGTREGFKSLLLFKALPNIGDSMDRFGNSLPGALRWVVKGPAKLMKYAGLIYYALKAKLSGNEPAQQPSS